jgi:hypothetical protein
MSVAALRDGITQGRFAHLPTIDYPPWKRRLNTLTEALIADLGGDTNVSTAEQILVERCAVMTLQCELMEAQWAERNNFRATDLQNLVHQRQVNALRRTLTALGLKRRPRDVTVTVEEYLRHSKQQQEVDDVDAEAEE